MIDVWFFFSSRRRHTRCLSDWSSDVCSSDLDENEATLTFQGSRTGIASWLAAPGAAGSAEYISSEAVFAFSASTRDPRQALDELLSASGAIAAPISRFESETGVSLSSDIGPSLGTDF